MKYAPDIRNETTVIHHVFVRDHIFIGRMLAEWKP